MEPVYLAGIRALGILDKIVTGPFFRLTENAKSVLDLNSHLQEMQKCFEQWSQDTSPLLEGETLFNEEVVPIHHDEMYESLFKEQSEQLETLTQEALVTVSLNRQKRYTVKLFYKLNLVILTIRYKILVTRSDF